MSEIHYFQRYSSRENVVTNNTLHLLSRVYEYSPARLKALFTQMFEQDNVELGVSFRQQTRGKNSVPDGMLMQSSVQIALETKVDAGINLDQLRRHLAGLPAGGQTFLLLLTRDSAAQSATDSLMREAADRGVIFKHLTFDRLCRLLEENVEPHETMLGVVVEDFVRYCSDEGLLAAKQAILRIVPCGSTLSLNIRHNIYYHPTDRSYRPFSYLGVYHDKRVKFVGRVLSVMDAEFNAAGTARITDEVGNQVNQCPYEAAIRAIVAETRAELGWDISTGHRFFVVQKFFPTDYRKVSHGGIQGPRNHDVTHLKPSDAEHLAELLRAQTWS